MNASANHQGKRSIPAEEWHKHVVEMQAIAEEAHKPFSEVEKFYGDLLEDMTAHAEVNDYLPILVSKKVRKIFGVRRG